MKFAVEQQYLILYKQPWKSLSKTIVFAHFPQIVGYRTSGVISGRQVSYNATTAWSRSWLET